MLFGDHFWPTSPREPFWPYRRVLGQLGFKNRVFESQNRVFGHPQNSRFPGLKTGFLKAKIVFLAPRNTHVCPKKCCEIGLASRALEVKTGLRIKERVGNDSNPRGVSGVQPKRPNQETQMNFISLFRVRCEPSSPEVSDTPNYLSATCPQK